MSEKQQAPAPTAPKTRRQLLTAAGKLSAVMAGLGLSAGSVLTPGTAQADECTPPEGGVDLQQLQKLIDHAIETGDMDDAVGTYADAAGLEDHVIDQLLEITASDLAAIKDVAAELREVSGERMWVGVRIIEHCTAKAPDQDGA